MEKSMHRFRRLMVALSNTDTDDGLLRYATTFVRFGTAAEMRLTHVLGESAPADAATAALDAMRRSTASHLAGLSKPVATVFDVLRGPLLDQLLEYTAAHGIDLVLLGHRLEHPGRWALSRRMAMKAPCSILMVPEGSPPSIERILVPIDLSEPAADALRVGIALARLAGLDECLALHVYFEESRLASEEHDAVVRGREAEAIARFLAPIDCRGVAVKPVFEEGVNVAHAIQRIAEREGCDLVVLATRGRSRSAAVLLGSVAEETIMETRIPLLVVKHYGAQIGLMRALWEKVARSPNEIHF